MRKAFTGLAIFLSCNLGFGQFVVTDNNFAVWLDINAGCMSGNVLDTNCAATFSTTNFTIDVNSWLIANLSGLQFFKNLDSLQISNCGNNVDPIWAFPNELKYFKWNMCLYGGVPPLSLPDSLEELICDGGPFTPLPILPPNLKALTCSTNSWLNSLPSLPSALEEINIYNCANFSTLPALPGGMKKLTIYNSNTLTSLPALPDGITYMDVSSNILNALPALPDSLQSLFCSSNNLTALPTLPGGLKYLSCAVNSLTALSLIPSGLKELYCYNNIIASIPPLPTSLEKLGCGFNSLTSLPALPSGLKYLHCSANNFSGGLPDLPPKMDYLNVMNCFLTVLPAVMPDTIETFYCQFNQLTTFPSINYVKYLYCHDNQLTSLPSFGYVGQIYARNNQITTIAPNPTSLYYLDVSKNLLTSLPNSPTTYQTLKCDSNQITSLPAILNVSATFHCQENQINCFPKFTNISNPANFNISGNPATCLPNYVAAMDAATLLMPLCLDGDLINNPNSCNSISGISGTIYTDQNTNCLLDGAEPKRVNIPIKIYSGATLVQQTYSLSNGVYQVALTNGTYKVVLDTAGLPFNMQCSNPGIDSTVTVSSNLRVVNFNLACGGVDVGATSVVPVGLVFPGQQHEIRVKAGSISKLYGFDCDAGASGQVTITVNGPVTFAGPSGSALIPSVAGNVYSYTIADFGSISNDSAFRLNFDVSTGAGIGDSVSVLVVVTSGSDINHENDTLEFRYPVVNSFDPNIKETHPVKVQPGYVDYFTYTIHFQNTGTASAINISLLDTLDANLDPSSFELLNYSHANLCHVKGNLLSFHFKDIYLPDSTSNEPASHGFVQYRIKPDAGLLPGTDILNKAGIYFDYNNPVITNSSVNHYTAIPSIDISGPTTVCEGDSTFVTVSFTGEGPWNFDLNGVAQPAATGSVTIGFLQSGPMSFVVNNYSDYFGENASLKDSIFVSTIAYPSLSLQNSTICNGSTVILVASNADSYLWSPGSSTNDSLSVSPATTSDYILIATNGGLCSATDTATITVDVIVTPTASAGGTQTICSNSSATVSGATAGNGTILWTHNGSGTISSATTLTPTYTASSLDEGNTVTLTETVTSSNACGTQTATATYTVNVDPMPTATAGGTQTICSNSSATVSGATAANGTILWTHNGSGTISNATILTPTYTASFLDGGNTVTLTETVTSNNACGTQTATATYTVNVDPMPTATSGGTQTICSNSSATVSGATAANGTILWTHNGSGTISSGTTLTPTYTASSLDEGNTVTLTETVTSNNGCGTQTATASFAVFVDPCTGIAEANSKEEINIFPNPTSGKLTIQCDCSIESIKIANVLGQEILFLNQRNSKVDLDLEAYPSGLYFIIIQSESNQTLKKVVRSN